MKIKKIVLFASAVAMILALTFSTVYANMAPIPRKYLTLASIMRLISLVILLTYIVSSICYLVTSKKSKNEKIKKLVLWLVIIIIIRFILCYGADFVLENARKW